MVRVVQLSMLSVMQECVPQYGKRSLQVASPGRRPERKMISSGLTSPIKTKQDIVDTVWNHTNVQTISSGHIQSVGSSQVDSFSPSNNKSSIQRDVPVCLVQ